MSVTGISVVRARAQQEQGRSRHEVAVFAQRTIHTSLQYSMRQSVYGQAIKLFEVPPLTQYDDFGQLSDSYDDSDVINFRIQPTIDCDIANLRRFLSDITIVDNHSLDVLWGE
jgi:hypothetical protein